MTFTYKCYAVFNTVPHFKDFGASTEDTDWTDVLINQMMLDFLLFLTIQLV